MRVIVFVVSFMLLGISAFGQAEKEIGLLYSQRKYEQVLVKAGELMAKQPANAFAYEITGRIYVHESKFDSALPFLSKAILLDDDSTFVSGWAHAYLGYSLIYLGNKDKGITELMRCVIISTTENSVQYATRVLDSIGYDIPVKKYDKNYLPKWVIINRENIVYNFQDTTGISSVVYRYMKEHDEAFLALNKFFEAKLPGKITFYVWNDKDIAQKILKHSLGYTSPKQCFSHVQMKQTVGHELTHTLAYWSWGMQPVAFGRFVSEGIAVCYDLAGNDKYALARKVIEKEGVKDVMDIWENEKDYDEKVLYPVAGAFMKYLQINSSPEQFRQILKNQTIAQAKVIYGERFLTLVADFNHLMALK